MLGLRRRAGRARSVMHRRDPTEDATGNGVGNRVQFPAPPLCSLGKIGLAARVATVEPAEAARREVNNDPSERAAKSR